MVGIFYGVGLKLVLQPEAVVVGDAVCGREFGAIPGVAVVLEDDLLLNLGERGALDEERGVSWEVRRLATPG